MLAELQSKTLSLDNPALDVPAGWADDVVNDVGHPQKLVVQMPVEERPKRTTAANPSASEWAYTVPMLRSTQKKLLDVLALHSDKWGVSWCSQKTLAFEVGCSDRRIRDLLKVLEGRKLIRRIGRVGKHGAQLTDVVILIGWPDRKLIPTSGHRTLKLAIQENEETRYLSSLLRAQAQTKFPGGAEKTSDQNKDNLNNTTTAQLEKAVAACFDALGPWATIENMQGLSDDPKTLKGWLDKGIDLHLHILPVLAEKARNKAKIPLLRTWRYFEVPIGKAVNGKQSKAKNMQVKAKQVQTALPPSEETTQEANVPAAFAAVPSPAEPRSAFQYQNAAATIARMPATYMTYPGSQTPILPATRGRVGSRGAETLLINAGYLWSFGELQVPLHLWRSLVRHDAWIEPALVYEWSRLMDSYARTQDRELYLAQVARAMRWHEPSRDVAFARKAAADVMASGKLFCVWTGRRLSGSLIDIDHCLPWAAWPCEDLWNLLPVHPQVNRHSKRDRLPSSEALEGSQERILDWWQRAWLRHPSTATRFHTEAQASLPLIAETAGDPSAVFSGLQIKRFTLRADQQVMEWSP